MMKERLSTDELAEISKTTDAILRAHGYDPDEVGTKMQATANLCKLLGHMVTVHDHQYPVCDRCGAHGYYDGFAFDDTWHWWPLRLCWWLRFLPTRIRAWRYKPALPDDEIPF